jgi:uncharacterized membrane protein
MRLGERIREIEHDERLDPAASRMRKLARHLPAGRVRDVLHGVPLGHPAHPILVHLPMGTWLAAVLLDTLPGDRRRGAQTLINIGLLSSLPAAVSGLADWSQQHERQQRVGVAHVAANGAGVLLFGASSLARILGRQGWGRAFALAGMGAVGVGGTLGGHITYYRAGGVNRADHLLDLVPEGWHDLGPLDTFPEDDVGQADVDGVPVVVARTNGSVRALLGTCPHLGAPLGEGTLVDGCVRCPWTAGRSCTGPRRRRWIPWRRRSWTQG